MAQCPTTQAMILSALANRSRTDTIYIWMETFQEKPRCYRK